MRELGDRSKARGWDDAASQIRDGERHRVAPGKRTRTQRLAEGMWPVVASAEPATTAAERPPAEAPRTSALDGAGFLGVDLAGMGAAGAAAAAGVESASATLPHAEVIQRAFGRHGIGNVRVEIGGAAAASARAIGAAAYAVGERIAFASAPDLHTAAHEAAHVIQQRAGVVPRGRGTQGDSYEQHADRVADAVVAGRSAEAILDEIARSAGARGAAALAVQCRHDGPAAHLVSAGEYLRHNAIEVMEGVRRHLAGVKWPEPHPRLGWRDRWRFQEALVGWVDVFLHRFQQTSSLARLVHPVDALAIVDQLRPTVGELEGHAVGPTDWRPMVGLSLGEALAESMMASLAWLGPRWLGAARRAHGALDGAFVDVPYDALVTSHPVDRVVGRAMCTPGVFDVRASRAGEADDLAGVQDAMRPVTVAWQGHRSPRLWNWVRAEPADATVEEVAAALFGGVTGDGEPASFRAYRLRSAAPYFCVPAEWAIEIDAAKAHAPREGAREVPATEAYAAVASGALGDEIALAQAAQAGGRRPAGADDLAMMLDDSADLAGTIGAALEPWELAAPVAGLAGWIDGKRDEVAGMDAAARGRWTPVLSGQKAHLSRIAGAVVEVTRAASAMGVADRRGPDAAPLREILETCAHAAATSHMEDTCRELVERAARLQTRLPVRALASARRQLGAAMSLHQGAVAAGDPAGRVLGDEAYALDQDARALAARMMAGGAADAAELDELMLASGELALRARMDAIDAQLGTLESAAHASADGAFARVAALGSPHFLNLASNCGTIRERLAWIRHHGARHVQANRAATSVGGDPRAVAATLRRYRQEALTAAQEELARLSRNEDIAGFLRKGADLVEWQAFRTAVVKMAALIGVSLVGGALGGVIARGATSALTRVGAPQALARIAASGAGLAAETTTSALGQVAVTGGGFSDAFVENLIAGGAGAGLSGLFRAARSADAVLALDARTHTFWQRVGGVRGVGAAASFTGDFVLQSATGYAARQAAAATTQPPPETVKEWLLEGASFAVGRAVGQQIALRRPGLERLAATGELPEATRALAATRLLSRKASALEKRPDPDAALDLLARQHELLTDDLALIDALARDPARLEAAGIQRAELGPIRRELAAQLAAAQDPAQLDTTLHLAGLEELAAGALWKGTRDQIDRALAHVRDTHPTAQIHHEPGATRWRIALGDHNLVLHERQPARLGRGLPTYAIRKRDIVIDAPSPAQMRASRLFYVEFKVTGADGTRIDLGHGGCILGDDGQPSEPPHFTITSDVRRRGEEHAVHIYDDVMLPGGDGAPMGLGERSSTTRFILEAFNKLHQERFGEEPSALGGLLAWENLRNFQREYHKAEQPGMSVEEIAQVAIRRASFGKHRAALGYDHFQLTLGDPEFVDLGPDLGIQKVPPSASAVAHRRKR